MTQETILLLGGTKDAIELAEKIIAEQPHNRLIYSIAGRTKEPRTAACECRIGGFGGVSGLIAFLEQQLITQVIDATHPFAHQISKNAKAACEKTGVSLQVHSRPPWQKQEGDNWQSVTSFEKASKALPTGAKVLLALGAKLIDEFPDRENIQYVIRVVDPPEHELHFKNHELIIGKPSPDSKSEQAMLSRYKISHIICRNSGGKGAYAKIEAARNLGLPVIMIERPTA